MQTKVKLVKVKINKTQKNGKKVKLDIKKPTEVEGKIVKFKGKLSSVGKVFQPNPSWETTYQTTEAGKSKLNTEKALIKLFKLPFSPSAITPRNDYYTYINYRWIYEQGKILKEKKQYFVQQDSFRMSQDEVYHEMIELTENYIKNNNDKRAKLLNNVYKSFLNLDETAAKNHVKHIKDFVDDYLTNKTLIEFLSEINTNEVVSWGSPIVWGLSPDEKQFTNL